MSTEHDKEWMQFKADLLQSKFKGVHTEKEMVERLTKLIDSGNVHAKKAFMRSVQQGAPDSRMNNSIWEKGAIYAMGDVHSPEQTGPAGSDNFGLWKNRNNVPSSPTKITKFK